VTLESLSVSPNPAAIIAGRRQLFVATGYFSDGTQQTLTSARWKSSDPAVATVSSSPLSSGVATGKATGTTSIDATYDGKMATVSLTVDPGRRIFSSSQEFTVPPGITSVYVTVTGGSAADNPIFETVGGLGAVVYARLTITQHPAILGVVVGAEGSGGSVTGTGWGGYSAFGSGGNGGGAGAGGGGSASGIFVGTPSAADALVVAGGGGGEAPFEISGPSGNAGTLSPGGTGAGLNGGSGGTETGPGAAGAPGWIETEPPVICSTPTAGDGPNGGNGGGAGFYGGGGGGGGGWYGGGGGGCIGVGGGGSSYVASSTIGGATATYRSSNLVDSATGGSVVIAWG
jgi:hypothetical protein